MILKTLPLTTNRLYRGRRFLTREGKENKESLAREARAAWGAQMPYRDAVALEIDLYWPDLRRHDVDNIKGLLDSLSGILYEDDSQIQDLRIRKYLDKKNPRVELRIFVLN